MEIPAYRMRHLEPAYCEGYRDGIDESWDLKRVAHDSLYRSGVSDATRRVRAIRRLIRWPLA